jgi:hypothetical protein
MAITLVALAISCAALAEAQGSSQKKDFVPESIAGMKMKYSDLHGNYTVTFHNDGSYAFVSSRENEKPAVRKGRYKWEVKDGANAVLELVNDDTYTLTFQSPGHATGQVTDDVRTYRFTFSK